ncbi:type IX secretion system protein PorD [Croceimicrobium hydrocarbonivorans]|uniref:DUF4835 family protein n=1 Tax=Croceimicrobium hydrocarbonivorans TaxID=2761580 RepID=A0A7H0VEJ5_9FLAO|nr:DUF4835 family protein [Croceimicrobium hydrocarbonivorans]QNR24143.1 DUF4835 family protein [Croceimicrobium hydrocarbonivorans]
MKFWIGLLSIILLSPSLQAQELNARVQVLTPNIQATNKQLYTTLETAIREFLNNRKWTEESYSLEERIDCQFVLTINSRSNNTFSGHLQIFYSRPIFNSDYASPILVHRDNDVNFEYLEFDRLDFAPNSFISNLTSILAYYAYIVIGLDHDSYAPMSGTDYYNKAQNIVGNAQTSNYGGWDSFGGSNKNRYWLVDNLISPAFDNFRTCLYTYHRQGLDLMNDASKIRTAKMNIKEALKSLKKVNDQRRNSFLLQLWFDAKQAEIVKIFSDGASIPTADLKEVLIELDPNNASEYQKVGQGG